MNARLNSDLFVLMYRCDAQLIPCTMGEDQLVLQEVITMEDLVVLMVGSQKLVQE
jgi:hypothetical protein